jgi:hypothetical protein
MSEEAAIFDEGEPREELPDLSKSVGEYLLNVEAAEKADTFYGKKFFATVTVLESKGPDALPAGTRAKYKINLEGKAKAAKYIAERVKGFVYPLVGRRNIPGVELSAMLGDASNFVGKKIRAKVQVQRDEEGEPKTSDSGDVYTETKFSAV